MSDTFDPADLAWVLDDDSLAMLMEALSTCTEVVMDLETTGLDEHAVLGGQTNEGYPARVALASLTLPQPDDADPEHPTTWVLPLSHPDSPWLGRWRRVFRGVCQTIKRHRKPWINANVKYDSRWTKQHAGVDLSHLITWDTQVSSHALDENASTKLKERVPDTFDVERWDDFDLSTPGAAERIPMFDLGTYAGRDTYWAWRLSVHHRRLMYVNMPDQPETPEDIEHARLGRLMTWVGMPAVATLASIEQRGILLDVDWVSSELTGHEHEASELFDRLSQQYTYDVDGEPLDPEGASFAPTSLWFRRWSAKAVEAGDLVVAALTPNGKPQWSKSVLNKQANRGSGVARDLLDLRGHLKKAEFLRSWLYHVTPEGTIHTNYNTGYVVTGRLSSSSPNLQQVTASLKEAFIPRMGYLFAELDYSQIELRSAAHIAQCQPMIEAFRRGEDLHRILAARITNKEPGQVTPEERQRGKAGNFGFLYGMGPYGFMAYAEDNYGVVVSLDEAVGVHRAFFSMWDGLSEWHAKAATRVHQTGQVVSPLGRVRRLPSIWDANDKVVAFAERAAINSPVQGFASDLMMIAAASIEGTLPGHEPVTGARLVGTVHDSILIEVPEDDWKDVVLACRDRMERVGEVTRRLDCELTVPLVADIKVGTRWGLSDVATL